MSLKIAKGVNLKCTSQIYTHMDTDMDMLTNVIAVIISQYIHTCTKESHCRP